MKPENLYEEHTVSVPEDGEDVSFRYRLLRPEASDSQKKFPLVVFFHGAGERGANNT
ncbi:MAG TPA: phospholipase, partial [Verrucomicrobiales bacterium]|nr:phospholipase [Verrucomicrobiales bacterium]